MKRGLVIALAMLAAPALQAAEDGRWQFRVGAQLCPIGVRQRQPPAVVRWRPMSMAPSSRRSRWSTTSRRTSSTFCRLAVEHEVKLNASRPPTSSTCRRPCRSTALQSGWQVQSVRRRRRQLHAVLLDRRIRPARRHARRARRFCRYSPPWSASMLPSPTLGRHGRARWMAIDTDVKVDGTRSALSTSTRSRSASSAAYRF